MKKIILILALILPVFITYSQSCTFTQTFIPGSSYLSNALKGDFNNDGKMDFIVNRLNGLNANIQMPNNTFSTVATSYTPSIQIYNCSDYNGDGKADVLANNNRLFLGNGNGTFSLTTINQNFSSYASISSDFNNDGKTDVVSVSSNTNALLSIYIGQGNGNFNVTSSYTLNGASRYPQQQDNLDVSRIASNDFNHDSNQDLAISTVVVTGSITIGYLSIYLGNGNGTFNAVNTYTYNYDIRTVKISDMDGDGFNDLVTSSSNGVYVIKGDGLGSFEPYYSQFMFSSSIDVGDMNNDGKKDIINFQGTGSSWGCSSTNMVSILGNSGSSFSANTIFTINGFSAGTYYGLYSPIICEDFNNDGKIDLAVNTFSCTATVSICYNTTSVPLTASLVWPGDANSDGLADNLDILELGLHYGQTGTPRASTSNLWQSYYSGNWTGTITNGKNLNHSNCNGDGTINDDDTLAIFNNYNLTHAFKTNQTTTNPQITIVPDQSTVAKGSWGTSSIYLGDATTHIANVNGVAFTVHYDNNLIDLNSVWIEYPTSFINASNQNLKFRKRAFANGKLYTATTHTVNGNVSGYGKIAILHYKINPTLATDNVLNLSLSQANQSSANGSITPLTSGSATLMAIGASVGVNELINGNYISIHPNPTNGALIISSTTELQKIEVVAITGQLLMSEVPASANHLLHLDHLVNGIYFVNLYQGNHIVKREKIILQR